MGESLLAILFEGGTILLLPASQVSLGRLYCGALFGVALSFSFKVFYADIDNQVLRRGTHAIRWHRNTGLIWSLCHFFFHAALILSATGLGLALRGAAVRPSVEAAVAAALAQTAPTSGHLAAAAPVAGVGDSPEAAAQATAAAAQALLGAFDTTSRWVFTAGTFGALLVLVTLSLAHKPGPRAATRTWRLALRTVVSVTALVGLPMVSATSLGGLGLLGVVATVVSAMAIVEYVLLECDRIGWFRSELSVGASSGDLRGGGEEEEDDWEVGVLHPTVTTGTAGIDGGAAGRFSGKPDAPVEDYDEQDEQYDVEEGAHAAGQGDWSDGAGNTRADAGGYGPTAADAAAAAAGGSSAVAAPAGESSVGAASAAADGAADAATDADGSDAEEQPALGTAVRRARFWAGEDGTLTVSGVRYKTYDAAGGEGGCQPATFF